MSQLNSSSIWSRVGEETSSHKLPGYKGCLMFNDRLDVPASLRSAYIAHAHAGHQGTAKPAELLDR
jgi:hypothetical protein